MWIVAGHTLIEQRSIANAVRDGSNLVQTAAECDQSISRNSPISWLETDNSTKRGRLTNGSASVGAQRSSAQICGNRNCASARTSPWNAIDVPRISHHSPRAFFARRSHGKFVQICFANNDRPSLRESIDHSCIERRTIIFQDA